ncbi:MAG: hypothetical protein F2700_13145, partial [Actinobacteria bacterium]|nr:hypothetical protein [Actinomycetota bacterium]
MEDRPNPWQQLSRGIDLPFDPALQIPRLVEVELAVIEPQPIADACEAARQAVLSSLAGSVTPGMTVAVGGGSRGLTDRVGLMRGTILGLRELG